MERGTVVVTRPQHGAWKEHERKTGGRVVIEKWVTKEKVAWLHGKTREITEDRPVDSTGVLMMSGQSKEVP